VVAVAQDWAAAVEPVAIAPPLVLVFLPARRTQLPLGLAVVVAQVVPTPEHKAPTQSLHQSRQQAVVVAAAVAPQLHQQPEPLVALAVVKAAATLVPERELSAKATTAARDTQTLALVVLAVVVVGRLLLVERELVTATLAVVLVATVVLEHCRPLRAVRLVVVVAAVVVHKEPQARRQMVVVPVARQALVQVAEL